MTRTTRNSNRVQPSQSTTRLQVQGRTNKVDCALLNDDFDALPYTKRRKLKRAPYSSVSMQPLLLDLGKLLRGTLVKRPSAVIKSPYVADVSLLDAGGKITTVKAESSTTTTLLAHAPALDVGGMCVVGSEIYLSERSGEGKTSHSIELVRGAPLGSVGSTNEEGGVLVGAHPRLGELIAEEVLKLGLLREALPLKCGFRLGPVNDFKTSKKKDTANKNEVPKKDDFTGDQPQNITTAHDTIISNASSEQKVSLSQQVTLGDSRVDFQITLTQHDLKNSSISISHRVVFEVKNVVCADYESGTEPIPSGPGDCVIVAPASNGTSSNDRKGYQRSALFPWGRIRGQKFEGRSVVSERACKHLRNLQSLLDEDDVTPVVLFIVNRSDCESARACREKCPVFAEILEDVVRSGVKALAVRVRWTDEGKCFFDGIIPVHV